MVHLRSSGTLDCFKEVKKMSSSDNNDFVKPLTLHERGFLIQESIERQNKADAKWNILLNNFKRAIDTLKLVARQNLCVIDKNILVGKGGRLELLSRNDFLCANSEEANKNYIHIRDALWYCEKIEKFNNPPSITKKQQLFEKLEPNLYSFTDSNFIDETIKFLYEASLGDLKVIEDLAILTSEIRCSLPAPTVILADNSIHKKLFEFLEVISKESIISNEFLHIDFKKTLRTNQLRGLAYNNWNNFVLSAICIEGDLPESESKVIQLRKIMHGKTVSVKHPYFSGKMFIKNQIPFIYITESHEKYLMMKNLYGAKGIKIPSKSISQINYIGRDCEWLKNNFAYWGLMKKCLKTSTSYKYLKITEDDIFSAFKEKLCIFNDKSDCPTQELYKAYSLFYKSFYGETPLTFRQFHTRFATFAGLESCRPHHSSKSNPRCFKGIKINTERYDVLVKNSTKTVFKCTEKEFTHRLFETMRNEETFEKLNNFFNI